MQLNIQLVYRIPVILALEFTSRVDLDQLASEKPADPDLHCFLNRIYLGRCSLYKVILYCNKIFFKSYVILTPYMLDNFASFLVS